MKIGIFDQVDDIGKTAGDLRAAEADGIDSYWLTQAFGTDTLTVLGAVARDLPGLRVGTAVVPVYPRHPMALAQQALTTNLLVDGRLALGIGPSHPSVVEPCWGMSYDRPARYMREYLEALTGALTQRVRFRGEVLTARGNLDIPGAPVPPVLVAALGPKMLEITGTLADGTITWMVGPRTLRELTVPAIGEAAAKAGRPAPEVIVALPVCVTGDAPAALARAEAELEWYGTLPSYRAMLDREGCATPGGMALIGDADTVAERIRSFAGLGATTFAAKIFGTPDERAATRALIASLAR
ncbi:TIGR03564 family F420-dependent LLM class oxidoreductase [Actinomadura sp. GC306]|uniref:TIGR03564 family F420-dependent LLM class oxidoreductase n=1 Tax=Actinomadura sp. GC306 TaxID=2530367 RepID=UPI00104F56CE|nr:TIGR03564 family F420-dependent LLM class oxidoreductase [Actinomadura sp. GC306]TDC64606.1 TIGR03564 family F420-dependent LLM class oxidoreductase [Actinomadura sp. GC306]